MPPVRAAWLFDFIGAPPTLPLKSKSTAARTGGIYGSKETRWVFVGPAMLVVICLLVYPLMSTLVYSFTNKNMIRPDFDVIRCV